MCPQRAEADIDAPAVDEIRAALNRGVVWLTALIDERGCVGGSDLASLYYKLPAALALNGQLGAALRTLDWMSRHLLGPQGELAVPAGQPPARAYDRGWLVWGAAMCGRYDVAFRLADDLARHQHAATGGFVDTLQDTPVRCHAMTAGMAGLGLLAVRHVAAARRAGDFLVDLLTRQPAPATSCTW